MNDVGVGYSFSVEVIKATPGIQDWVITIVFISLMFLFVLGLYKIWRKKYGGNEIVNVGGSSSPIDTSG